MSAILLGAALGSALGAAYLGGLRAGAGSPRPEFAREATLAVLGAGPELRPASAAESLSAEGGARRAARDLDCLTQAIYFEARGESPAGQAAVAQVVLNRVRKAGFPKTVCGVVFQGSARGEGCQFSFTCDGSMHRGREIRAWAQARRIADRALAGAVMTAVGDATHFHTVHVSPDWNRDLLRVAQVGLHVFYRVGRPGLASAEVAEGPAEGVTLRLSEARLVSQSTDDTVRAKEAALTLPIPASPPATAAGGPAV
ncbi:MAG: cell wall hydrolase [Phenylobacterium sp.]